MKRGRKRKTKGSDGEMSPSENESPTTNTTPASDKVAFASLLANRQPVSGKKGRKRKRVDIEEEMALEAMGDQPGKRNRGSMSSAEIIASLTPTRRAAAVIASSSIAAAAAGNGSKDAHGTSHSLSVNSSAHGSNSSVRSSGNQDIQHQHHHHNNHHHHHHHNHRHRSRSPTSSGRQPSFLALRATADNKCDFNLDPEELSLSDGLALGLVQLSRPLWNDGEDGEDDEDDDEDDEEFYEDEDINNDEATLLKASQSKKMSARLTPPLLQTVLRTLRTMRNEQRRIDRLLQCIGDKLGITVADLKLLHHLEHESIDTLWASKNSSESRSSDLERLAESALALALQPQAIEHEKKEPEQNLPSVSEPTTVIPTSEIGEIDDSCERRDPKVNLTAAEKAPSPQRQEQTSESSMLDDSANSTETQLDITDPISPSSPKLNETTLLSQSFPFTSGTINEERVTYTPSPNLRRRLQDKGRLVRRRKLLKDIFSGIPLHNYFSEEEDDEDDLDEQEDEEDENDDEEDEGDSVGPHRSGTAKSRKSRVSRESKTQLRRESLRIRRLKPDSFDQLLQTFPRRHGLIIQEPKDCMENIFSVVSSLPEEINRNLTAAKALFMPNLLARKLAHSTTKN